MTLAAAQRALDKVVRLDEQQRLKGVRNAQGVHHYVYDGKGQRLMKTSIYGGLAGINNIDKAVPYTMDPYQVYVNAYHVTTFYGGDQWQDISNHYYMGSQRIASEMWGRFVGTELPDPPVDPTTKTATTGNYPGTGSLAAHSAWSDLEYVLNEVGMDITDAKLWQDLAKLPGYRQQFPILPDWKEISEACARPEMCMSEVEINIDFPAKLSRIMHNI